LARAFWRSAIGALGTRRVRLMALTNTTVMSPAQTDSSNTPASGAPIWNMISVSTALVRARPMAERSSVDVRTVHSEPATSSAIRILVV